ncbi:Recombination protein RecR [Acholeplasma oculi]|uniref:Recombination protein RecR n=1 Tax=Acholeplasma oculi TaxID=35623 RepID=A0A061ACF6_9MOLU|nr:recombination mediator RecR [Acholeplasma oculi]CDR31523.1 Recombination protein RecR [Acholeplasma oculi]SKC49662.1 DNA replication and repair protein RecR [Acholeplasma oculi]SUT92352.1 Recombination protein RecR [Acholeplasma oculi]
MYPKIILDLILDLKKLPGIGEKSAERLALYLTQLEQDELELFGSHLKDLKTSIKYCKTCGLLTDDETCDICKNHNRSDETIMVLSDSKDVFAIEKTQTFFGKYHVLNGLIDFSRGIEPKDLNIDALAIRIKDTKEIIIATNSTVEGELTAQYIKTLLSREGLTISRLGYGLPVGADLKYADQLTLIKAVENRQKY